MLLDLLVLTTWSLGIFLGPLLTALPPYPRAAWWLWPAVRVLWVFGGGVASGAATARLVGADLPAMGLSAFLVGTVGMVLSVAPMMALARGPEQVTGRLVGATTDARLQYLPQAPAARVSTTWVRLETPQGPVELRLRGIQGTRAQQALEALGAARVTVTWLPNLRAFVAADAA